MKRTVIMATGFCLLALGAGCKDSADKERAGCECKCEQECPVDAQPTTTVTRWLGPKERTQSHWAGMGEAVNQAGQPIDCQGFAGMPTAMSFLYTRCQNPNKCPLVASTMAKLQGELKNEGLSDCVRLLVVTYDPEFDEPRLLQEYGARHGFAFGANAMYLRPAQARKMKLFDDLGVSVNFNAEGVNIHGIQLFLFDKEGRFVRRYHTLIWNNTEVVADLKKLSVEP